MANATYALRFQAGFTYVGVLVLVAVLGITAAATAALWRTESRREAETELLFVGNQYRQAIREYYDQSPNQSRTYPASLQDLLRDPRAAGTRRYLRKLYPDPITGGEDWGLVKGPAGEIMGVFSRSDEMPLKRGNFRRADAKFEDKQKYSEWVFAHAPNQSLTPAAEMPQPAKPRPGASRVPR